VETQSDLTMGMTVLDWWGVTKRKANATVMNKINADAFFKLLLDRLSRT
jgi:purine nucleosidase